MLESGQTPQSHRALSSRMLKRRRYGGGYLPGQPSMVPLCQITSNLGRAFDGGAVRGGEVYHGTVSG